jgi:hypothetical protein
MASQTTPGPSPLRNPLDDEEVLAGADVADAPRRAAGRFEARRHGETLLEPALRRAQPRHLGALGREVRACLEVRGERSVVEVDRHCHDGHDPTEPQTPARARRTASLRRSPVFDSLLVLPGHSAGFNSERRSPSGRVGLPPRSGDVDLDDVRRARDVHRGAGGEDDAIARVHDTGYPRGLERARPEILDV